MSGGLLFVLFSVLLYLKFAKHKTAIRRLISSERVRLNCPSGHILIEKEKIHNGQTGKVIDKDTFLVKFSGVAEAVIVPPDWLQPENEPLRARES